MTGEMRPSAPPPPPGSSSEPARPPCAIAGNTLFLGDTIPTKVQFESFVGHVATATEEQCSSCLEAPETEIPCPGKDPDFSLDTARRIHAELAQGSAASPRHRLGRLLTNLAETTPIKPIDDEIRRFMSKASQKAPQLEFDNPPPEGPISEHEVQQEPLAKHEPRPPCAGEFVLFYRQRSRAIEIWRNTNLDRKLKRQKTEPIDHSSNKDTYARAVELANLTDPKDCADCLGLNCPLRNEVHPKDTYDSTSKSSEVKFEGEGGELIEKRSIKTMDVILRILKGTPRSSIPRPVLNKVDQKLAKRAEEAQDGKRYRRSARG